MGCSPSRSSPTGHAVVQEIHPTHAIQTLIPAYPLGPATADACAPDTTTGSDTFETSFADALASPDFAEACVAAAQLTGYSDTGLKVLREVNKEISKLMLRHIHGATFKVGDPDLGNIAASRFLRTTALSDLHINVSCEEDCQSESRHSGENLLRLDLVQIIAGLGSATSTVTKLFLTTCANPHSTLSEDDDFLCIVPPACPALMHLSLHGHVPLNVAEAFGRACPGIHLLELDIRSLDISTLKQLSQLLPKVWNVAFHAVDSEDADEDESHDACTRAAVGALASSSCITHINIGYCTMDQYSWAYLPATLKVLICSYAECGEGPAGCVCLRNLENLQWRCNLQGASSILLAAPSLQEMNCKLVMNCDPASLPCWDVFRRRLEAGLGGHISVGVYFDDERPFGPFLSLAEPSIHIRKVRICSQTSDPVSDLGCLQDISRVFPRVENLKCYQLAVEDENLQALLSCEFLQKLVFCFCDSITRVGVSMMAARLPALTTVKFEECSDFDSAAGHDLVSLLHLYRLLAV